MTRLLRAQYTIHCDHLDELMRKSLRCEYSYADSLHYLAQLQGGFAVNVDDAIERHNADLDRVVQQTLVVAIAIVTAVFVLFIFILPLWMAR